MVQSKITSFSLHGRKHVLVFYARLYLKCNIIKVTDCLFYICFILFNVRVIVTVLFLRIACDQNEHTELILLIVLILLAV